MTSVRKEHLETLHRALRHEGLSPVARDAFDGMLANLTDDEPPRYHCLTERQYAWVVRELEKLEPTYQNLFSAGKVPRGAEVPTPKTLQNLPKRPPARVSRGE